METPDLIEVTQRRNENGTFLFFLNHDTKAHDISLNCAGTDILTDKVYPSGGCLKLEAKGVAIIQVR